MGNNIKKIEMIDRNADTPRLKIFLFGSNSGKSIWFNERRDFPPLNHITFKVESFKFGDKLPDIETVIYDTAENIGLVDEHLRHVETADGIILTYDTQNIDTLNHLQYSIDQIMQNIFFSSKHTRCLLLGIKENSQQNPLHHEASNCIEVAAQFATRWNLFHRQIDITQDIHTKEPYLYLLRRILKQKGSDDSDDSDDDDNDSKDDAKSSGTHDDDDEDTLNLVQDIMGDFIEADLSQYSQKKHKDSNKGKVDHDAECQREFERFLTESLGKTRCEKYLERFVATCSNDIRFVDPDIFDHEFLTNDQIAMDLLDKKLFSKEIEKYKIDATKFEKKLDGLNMTEKYHRKFVNRGVATLWSFYHHMHSAKDIEKVIKNKHDASVVWETLGKEQKAKKKKRGSKKSGKKNSKAFKQNKKMNLLNLNIETQGGYQVSSESDHDLDQVEGDTSSDDGSVSDSEALYNRYTGSKADGATLNNTTDIKNDITQGIMVNPNGYKGGGMYK